MKPRYGSLAVFGSIPDVMRFWVVTSIACEHTQLSRLPMLPTPDCWQSHGLRDMHVAIASNMQTWGVERTASTAKMRPVILHTSK